MELLVHRLISETFAAKIHSKLLRKDSCWNNGKGTAGSHASIVKKNLQLERESTLSIDLSEEITNQIQSNQLIKSFALPKKLHGLMFSKSTAGDGYGMHVDNAYMSSGRSDLSFTLFLSEPENYEGGELCIQTVQETKEIKLAAGEIIIYPSTSLHSVQEIKAGERIVCVGWIESYIPSSEDRNLLFSLDAGARALLATHGQSDELNLIFQAYNNLLRRLG